MSDFIENQPRFGDVLVGSHFKFWEPLDVQTTPLIKTGASTYKIVGAEVYTFRTSITSAVRLQALAASMYSIVGSFLIS